jgi:hypothetical protein
VVTQAGRSSNSPAPDDLLLVGTGRRGPVRRPLGGAALRRCLAHGRSCVVAEPPSTQEKELTGTFLRRTFARRTISRITFETTPGTTAAE